MMNRRKEKVYLILFDLQIIFVACYCINCEIQSDHITADGNTQAMSSTALKDHDKEKAKGVKLLPKVDDTQRNKCGNWINSLKWSALDTFCG